MAFAHSKPILAVITEINNPQLIIYGPVKPGQYELRVYYDYPTGGYTVQAREEITVLGE